jgi:hypothetical protein
MLLRWPMLGSLFLCRCEGEPRCLPRTARALCHCSFLSRRLSPVSSSGWRSPPILDPCAVESNPTRSDGR